MKDWLIAFGIAVLIVVAIGLWIILAHFAPLVWALVTIFILTICLALCVYHIRKI
ncbi:hypothetical protein OF387_16995 [Lentilactobacillus hilgardii]|nr:hypothetical protein [Lentilactobacillus hilgardii]MCV3742934.1 hypothetical protein [Lentilactobacillus hilgardii]